MYCIERIHRTLNLIYYSNNLINFTVVCGVTLSYIHLTHRMNSHTFTHFGCSRLCYLPLIFPNEADRRQQVIVRVGGISDRCRNENETRSSSLASDEVCVLMFNVYMYKPPQIPIDWWLVLYIHSVL